MREAIQTSRIYRLHWIPTEAMLADDLTKAMLIGSGLWPILYQTGWWSVASRDDLPEDYVSMNCDGKIERWRLVNGGERQTP